MEKLLLDSIKNGKKHLSHFPLLPFLQTSLRAHFAIHKHMMTKVKSANDKNNTLGKLMAILQFNLYKFYNETSEISNIKIL